MPHNMISAETLIDGPLRTLRPPPSEDSLAPPKPSLSPTTKTWAEEALVGVVLASTEWDWKTGPAFENFMETLKATKEVNACVPEATFRYPRTEADIVDRVNDELVKVVHRVGQSWLKPPPQQTWHLEVLSESYANADHDTEYSNGGVRVDEIFVASFEYNGTLTRSMAKAHLDTVKSANSYLPRDVIWTRNEITKVYAGSLSLKSLVAIEIKKYGILNKARNRMQALGAKADDFGAVNTEIKDAEGIRIVLQQALRYAHHYGTQYVYVTDYKTGILLDVPRLEEKPKRVVRWAVVDEAGARKALAFLLHRACSVVRALVPIQGADKAKK